MGNLGSSGREEKGDGQYLQQLVSDLTNTVRRSMGRNAVSRNARLGGVAYAHSRDLCLRRFFDHINPDGRSPSDRVAASEFVGPVGEEILSQRIFGIACGYEDGNDAARIAADPVMKTLAGRDPFGEDLASQPSISRFECSATRKDLFRISMSLMKTVINAQRRGREGWSKRITIDLDQTPVSTHGGQQLTFFNGHYDTYCYIPLVAAISFAG